MIIILPDTKLEKLEQIAEFAFLSPNKNLEETLLRIKISFLQEMSREGDRDATWYLHNR